MKRNERLDDTSRMYETARTFITQKILWTINTRTTNDFNKRITWTSKTCKTTTEYNILIKRWTHKYDINKNIRTVHISRSIKTTGTFGTNTLENMRHS